MTNSKRLFPWYWKIIVSGVLVALFVLVNALASGTPRAFAVRWLSIVLISLPLVNWLASFLRTEPRAVVNVLGGMLLLYLVVQPTYYGSFQKTEQYFRFLVPYSLASLYILFLVCVSLGLVGLTGYIAKSLFTNAEMNAYRYLKTVVFAYLTFVIGMAALYVVLEQDTNGKAFSEMLPDSATTTNGTTEVARYKSTPLSLELDALYFSFVTAATVGYGDIRPMLTVPKLVVLFQIVVSQFMLLIILAFIVSNIRPPLRTPL